MSLTSRNFKYNRVGVKKRFEFILTQISECYKLMLTDYNIIENDENTIRNRLWKDYLNKNEIRTKLKLNQYIFHSESPNVDDEYKETGRHDIQVYNPIEFCKNTDAYFIIECKRLDGINSGKGSLNYKYIENGISRFTSRADYPTFYGINGMIGFVVKATNISKIIKSINLLLPDNENLNTKTINNDFDSSYLSKHTDYQDKNIELYHLMFDFSALIETD